VSAGASGELKCVGVPGDHSGDGSNEGRIERRPIPTRGGERRERFHKWRRARVAGVTRADRAFERFRDRRREVDVHFGNPKG